MGSSLRVALVALGVLSVAAVAPPARAADAAAAEALFGEGKKLVSQGKYAEACPKFAESNRLDRGAGTLIHLADCYEKVKQTASAWATYKEAASAAQALGRADWEKLANKRAALLEPLLARLTVRVQEPADKIEVTRDGAPVSQASWGVALPIDAGTHTIEAGAPGRRAYKTTVAIAKDGEKAEVMVPKLEADESARVATATAPPPAVTGKGSARATPPPPDADRGDGSTQRTIGLAVAGLGVVGVGVGAVTGLLAMGKNNDSKQDCPNDGPCASKAAVDAADSAKSLGTISTIGFVAGGVALGAGAVLILTAGSSRGRDGAAASSPARERDRAVRVVPAAGPKGASLSLSGAF